MKKKLLLSLLPIILLSPLTAADADPSPYRHWTFDTLIENGAATPDASPHQAHARLEKQTLCPGLIDQALLFPENKQGLALDDLALQAPATVCFWLKIDHLHPDRRILSQLEGTGYQAGCLRLAAERLQIWNTQGWYTLIPAISEKNIWQHVAVVFEENHTVTGCLNGKRKNTAQSAFDFNGVKAGFGAPFIGQHLRIYDKALSQTQIENLYPPELFAQAQAATAAANELTPFGKLARTEYLTPIRPGTPGKAPFWNVNSFRFMYAPAFDFKPIEGDSTYRFTATASDGKDYTFQADQPWASLTPIWNSIPTGQVQLTVEAIKDNQVAGIAGQRTFYRAAMYNGPYHQPVMDYQQSARLALTKLFNRDYIRHWLTSDDPHPNYPVPETPWAYPSKLIGAIIAGSATYATLDPPPPDAQQILRIGRNAADKLIEMSLPPDSMMEYFPLTYNRVSALPNTVIMLQYPADAALAYLDLFDVTHEEKYFEAARRIADTYKKLQLPNGTWYLMMDNASGKELYPHPMVPTLIVKFMDRLVEQYGLLQYQPLSEQALAWIMDNPLKTFNWAAQYEDAGRPLNLYESFSPAQALELALYLLNHPDEQGDNLKYAQQLLQFAEDQFVVWEKPMKYTRYDTVVPELKTENLLSPCVMEQYTYWIPVNLSSSHLIEAYHKAYTVTGRTLYLHKARDLANTLMLVQKNRLGEYSTYPVACASEAFELRQNVWTNGAVYTARVMNDLGRMLNDKTHATIKNHTSWTDTQGNLIQAHDGGISRFGDTFYWYGTSYAGNPTGKIGIMAPRLWNGVLVYNSKNLVDWTYQGLAVKRPDKGWGNLGTSGRPHVIYNEKTKKYVMWYWFHLHYPVVFQMVAVADSPTGPFSVLGPRQIGTDNGFASDHNLFKDDDGKAYLVYTDHESNATPFADWSNGRYAIRIDSLTDDYLASNQEGVYAMDHGCEAPSMIKYKGKYIVAASGVAGWSGTENYYTTADSPLGPYGKKKILTEKNQWGGQLSSLLYINESDTLMALCDQWWVTRDEHHTNHPAPAATDLNESRYLWLPVDFDADTETAHMQFLKQWNPFAR